MDSRASYWFQITVVKSLSTNFMDGWYSYLNAHNLIKFYSYTTSTYPFKRYVQTAMISRFNRNKWSPSTIKSVTRWEGNCVSWSSDPSANWSHHHDLGNQVRICIHQTSELSLKRMHLLSFLWSFDENFKIERALHSLIQLWITCKKALHLNFIKF